jgi:hypothetical protein
MSGERRLSRKGNREPRIRTSDLHFADAVPQIACLPRRLLLPVRPGVGADDAAAGAHHAGTERGHGDGPAALSADRGAMEKLSAVYGNQLRILAYATRMLDTVAPVCLGTIKRLIGCLENVGEIPAWIDRYCYSDADRRRQCFCANLQRCRLEV